MGKLELAGVVSGLGQGLQQGLTQLNSGIIQQGLQESSQDFQTKKLQEQQAHAERLHKESLAATASEGKLTRAAVKENLGTELGAKKEEGILNRDATKELHGLDSKSRELIAKEGNETHKEIAAQTNAVHLRIAEMQNKLGHQQMKATELSALQHDMDSVRDSLDRIDIKLMDPLADPESPIAKSLKVAQTQARARLTSLEGLMEARARDMQSKDGISVPAPAQPAERKPFNPGQYGTAPTPGVLQR